MTRLEDVLEATGYLIDGKPADGVLLGQAARDSRRGRTFAPDASWKGPSALKVYFKFAEDMPSEDEVGTWRKEIWNEGFSPLLWVISPQRIDVYNGFGRPRPQDDAKANLLTTFQTIDAALRELDALAGRLAMETGSFWVQTPKINRRHSVDHQLLQDLGALENDLVGAGLDRLQGQALIGRVIFTQYLIDRGIINGERLEALSGCHELSTILRDIVATRRLFDWLRATFNGDMFPPASATVDFDPAHLVRVADFLEAVEPITGQRSLFPYQFDVIPVELISSIYEQFAHSAAPKAGQRPKSTAASTDGVYYTRLPVVSLVLDEVMDGLTGKETVLDLTCGSGVFLVEAFRRLVHQRTRGSRPQRSEIRDVLYGQVFGVDISEAAVRVAAFSLYLAALELDTDPQPPEALKFAPLIGRTLFVGDARTIDTTPEARSTFSLPDGRRTFDIIVGNPPWSFKGVAGTAARRSSGGEAPTQPRGEGLDFMLRAAEFSHAKTRFGMVLSAMPFFAGSKSGVAAALHVVKTLAPVTLVNLSNLSSWLFPGAKMPAMALFSRHRPQPADQITLVQVPWAPAGQRTHTFDIAPSDVSTLSIGAWEAHPPRLKTLAFGGRRDLRLVDELCERFGSVSAELIKLGTGLRDGLIAGNPARASGDARALADLPLLQARDLRPFGVPDELPKFGLEAAERPRNLEQYRAPLVLIKEFLSKGARPVVGIANRDMVYTDAYFGAALPPLHRDSAAVLAGVLSSALAAWWFLMTASEFGLWKQRLFRSDVAGLPIPDLVAAAQTESGANIIRLAAQFSADGLDDTALLALDEAVFDLYGLDEDERLIVRDGLFKAGCEWTPGQNASIAPAQRDQLVEYTSAFVRPLDRWFAARGQRRLCAEIFELEPRMALRVVRFSLEEGQGPSRMATRRPDEALEDVLASIGRRLNVPLGSLLTGQRELRVHGPNEIIVIKPAAVRYWLPSVGLADADAVIAESMTRGAA